MVDSRGNFARELIAHGQDCDSSCYSKGCMRDYSNMPYHPFLDWRLGLDVARLCLDKDYQMNLQENYWSSLVNLVEKNLVELRPSLERLDRDGIPIFMEKEQGRIFILHHPLVSVDDRGGPHHASVIDYFDGQRIDVKFINIFDAIRRVSLVLNQFGQQH